MGWKRLKFHIISLVDIWLLFKKDSANNHKTLLALSYILEVISVKCVVGGK
ncbi:hypothetical protein EJ73_02612 [Hoylesella shahii DSM 15611 = JCM 12083]|uniref:Uncharacterized protein n=1 Tax=Hoylesella shahii DSM 15611 = JCM 12083 TaxID=1122991 RepID=A0A318HQ58_9BACT|nr:hypothetical protein EJ73_02612 [Hoylesella shahii DSM 15611 = JCM 12083]